MSDEEHYKSRYSELKNVIDRVDMKQVLEVLNVLRNAKSKKANIYLMGNGGSASTAEHAANDLIKFAKLKCNSLTTNSVITTFANDEPDHYESIFKCQLERFLDPQLNPNDVVIVITGSGNSPNIIKALKFAREKNIKTIGLLGFDGGQAKEYCDHFILVPSYDYGHIEDLHLSFLCHYFPQMLKEG